MTGNLNATAPHGTASSTPAGFDPLRAVGWGLLALIVLHVIVPVVLVLDRGRIEDGIRDANPDFTADDVRLSLTVALVAGVVFHALFVALYAWLGRRLRAPRPWVRIALTVVLVVATISSVVSWSQSPLFHLVIPVTDLLQVALIVLLWVPARSRAAFARR